MIRTILLLAKQLVLSALLFAFLLPADYATAQKKGDGFEKRKKSKRFRFKTLKLKKKKRIKLQIKIKRKKTKRELEEERLRALAKKKKNTQKKARRYEKTAYDIAAEKKRRIRLRRIKLYEAAIPNLEGREKPKCFTASPKKTGKSPSTSASRR